MNNQYSEQDTERARQLEKNSAGIETRQLSSLPPQSAPAGQPAVATPAARSNNPIALALIGIGGLLLLSRIIPNPGELIPAMILLTISSCFLFFAFWQRIYGLLIPGSILGGLSLGIAFVDITNGVSILWGLSLGFLSILVLGRSLYKVDSPWAAIPAVILFGVGLIVALAQIPAFLAGGMIWLPLLLIAAGLYLGWGRRHA